VIVPIAFSVKRENTPEEFVLTESELLPTFASREYMTALRDQLNKLLAEMEQSE
jgi:hypothetical protein